MQINSCLNLRACLNNTPRLIQITLTKYFQRRLNLFKPLPLRSVYQLSNRMIALHHVELAAIPTNQAHLHITP